MFSLSFREQYERYLQQQFLHQQSLAAQQQSQGDKMVRRSEEKDTSKPSGSPAEREQHPNLQQVQQAQKRASIASPSPYQQVRFKS